MMRDGPRSLFERIGLDDTYDGHVDRWDRDEQLKYESEAADRKARDEMMNAQMAANQDGGARSGTGGDGGAGTDAGVRTDAGTGVDAGAPRTP